MNKEHSNIIIRYLILLIVSFPNLFLFYLILAPLTIYPVYFLLGIFFDVSLQANTLFVGNFAIEIAGACIAGSAYYLLLILLLSTPGIDIRKRLKMLLLGFGSLLILNILRIFLLVSMLFFFPSAFDITHKIFWYFISIVFVVGVWFAEVKLFKIKQIPVYSDAKLLIHEMKKSQNTKKDNKS